MKKSLSKSGMSQIITTVIMIGIVLVAIGAVWIVVQNILSGGLEDVSLGSLKVDLDIESVKVVDDGLDIRVKRNSGEANLVGLNFIVSDGKNTEVFEVETNMKELATQVFELDYDKTLKSIEVAPILANDEGKEKTYDSIDKYEIEILDSCKEILDKDLSSINGTYLINYQGKETEVYCDMTTDGGGWTLLDNFISAELDEGYSPYGAALGGNAIDSGDDLEDAGWDYNLTNFDNDGYEIISGYLQMWYSGTPTGYIEKELPKGFDEIYIKWGNWIGGSTNLFIGGENVQSIGNIGASIYKGSYETSDIIRFEENSYYIFWVNEIWVR
ncbi:MAG: fibrinogen-like YCDxxxxGGGW domain-containing protein [Candidatus Pacearchaeota archaeon]|nr:fibrinogen-like YCDxxxxGGGW domain-containing protein [Candidatus Pacearchaeota archaeon]